MKPTLVEPQSPSGYGKVPFATGGPSNSTNTGDNHKSNYKNIIQLTTSITETSITNPTRITNKMATSSDYLMKYFNGILAVLLE